jgi:hypothetical protein
MPGPETQVYQALALPDEALANGGTEILRAGIIDGELYVTARRAFKDHTKWGDVLAEIAQRLALIYSAEDAELDEGEILTDIAEAIAADLGARAVTEAAKPKAKKKAAARKSPIPAARTPIKSKTTKSKRRKR